MIVDLFIIVSSSVNLFSVVVRILFVRDCRLVVAPEFKKQSRRPIMDRDIIDVSNLCTETFLAIS